MHVDVAAVIASRAWNYSEADEATEAELAENEVAEAEVVEPEADVAEAEAVVEEEMTSVRIGSSSIATRDDDS